jgi:hypothetical protein
MVGGNGLRAHLMGPVVYSWQSQEHLGAQMKDDASNAAQFPQRAVTHIDNGFPSFGRAPLPTNRHQSVSLSAP